MDRAQTRHLARSNWPAVRLSLLLLLFLCCPIANLAQVDGGGGIKSTKRPNIDAFGKNCGRAPRVDWSDAENAYPCSRGSRNYRQSPAASEEDASLSRKHRIAGGYYADGGEFPSYVQLSIRHKNNSFTRCGGTLIHANLVMTASHCITPGIKAIRARAGSVDVGLERTSMQQSRMALGACKHPGYVETKLEGNFFDVALVRLAKPFKYNSRVQPACLALDRAHRVDVQCLAVGMGATSSETGRMSKRLMALQVKREKCILEYKNETAPASEVSRGCYRASNMDFSGNVCRGDSGSAIYCIEQCAAKSRQVAVGITSGGLDNSCDYDNPLASIFADVHKLGNDLTDLINICKTKPKLMFDQN